MSAVTNSRAHVKLNVSESTRTLPDSLLLVKTRGERVRDSSPTVQASRARVRACVWDLGFDIPLYLSSSNYVKSNFRIRSFVFAVSESANDTTY